ncbi:MAG: DNA primase, partial [Bacteroidia bacterium]|nr:DNA primase [Bacteroidia bacterium]
LASSGTGKSYLQEKVSQCIPEEDKKEITALSPNSFYYQGQLDLKHKLILLEDLTGAESSMYPIRELQSKKYIIKEVSHKNSKGDTVTITKKVEGPVCIAACTTDEQIYEDNANRSFLIYLDDSKEQDERIMDYQRKLHAGKVDRTEEHKAKQLLQNVQRILKPVTIINPYAEYLQLPSEVFKKRRTNAHYLQFIEAITFYKQYQKEEHCDPQTGELYIQTTIEDIKEANELIKHILLRKSDELNGATRHYLELLKTYLKDTQQIEFKSKEVRQHYRLNPNSQKTYMMHLVQHGYIRKNSGDQKKGFSYSITNVNEYKALEEQVQKMLEQSMAKSMTAARPEPVEAVKQLKAVEQPTQPLKPKPVKEKSK